MIDLSGDGERVTDGCMMTRKITCDREQINSASDFSLLEFGQVGTQTLRGAEKKKPTVYYTVGPISPRTVPGTGRAAGGPLSPLMTSSSLYNSNSTGTASSRIGQAQTKPHFYFSRDCCVSSL